jgi:hypothetical protein
MCPSTAYQGAKTLCISNKDVGCSLKLFAASTMTPQCRLGSAILQFSSYNPPSLPKVYQSKGAPICSSTAYQGAKTLCIYDLDLGCSLKLFAASTMTLQRCLGSAIPQLSKNQPSPLQRRVSVWVQSYPHPQHIKVLKHFRYIQ